MLHNTKLSVRRPASKDRYSLLLRGLNPDTVTEMIELYVENMIGLNDSDYTLHPSPEREMILIKLKQPLSKGRHIIHVIFLNLFFLVVKYTSLV